jgi:hypothetical protein
MSTAWFIILSVAAVGLGFWLGRPRIYDQSLDEIEQRLSEGGDHQKVKRHTTFINFIQRKVEKGSDRRRGTRKPFQMR